MFQLSLANKDHDVFSTTGGSVRSYFPPVQPQVAYKRKRKKKKRKKWACIFFYLYAIPYVPCPSLPIVGGCCRSQYCAYKTRGVITRRNQIDVPVDNQRGLLWQGQTQYNFKSMFNKYVIRVQNLYNNNGDNKVLLHIQRWYALNTILSY